MNHVLRGQLISLGDLRLAGFAAIEGAAFSDEIWAGGTVDGSVDAAAAEEGGVGSIDNCVDSKGRDVAADKADARVDGR